MTTPRLYPQTEPHRRFQLDVGGGHELYVEQCGNPEGKPVVVLHGGPGAGCSPFMRRFFDPKRYNIVLFDQRGAGKSTPTGSLTNNTTWDLVEDLEKIRAHLDINRWQVFGGSWGSTLALLYAQTHPERVSELVLRGIFTMRRSELNWFYAGGAARFYPEAWADLISPIPEEEREDLITAYYNRLTSPDEALQLRFARPWVRWEASTAVLRPPRGGAPVNGGYARSFARIEAHYFMHQGWLDADDQIADNMSTIAHIPGVMVQGRYDIICPPGTAARLDGLWPACELVIVDDAGHALSEPGITSALVEATDRFARPS
ncbi:MAG: prolyl aminopeptidase [Pseudomonadota bacterium]